MSDEQEPEVKRCVHCNAAAEQDLLLGKKCARELRSRLRDIPPLYAALDTRPGSTGNPYSPAKRQKPSGSPALIRLDVAVLQDPRTKTGAKDHEAEDDHDQQASVPVIFTAWANAFANTLGLRNPDGKHWTAADLDAAIALLSGEWFTSLCRQPDVADLCDDVEATWWTLRRAIGATPPRRLGQCGCGAQIYEPEPVQGKPSIIECRKCGHRMDALSVVRLAAMDRATWATGTG